jgi:DNA-directed RNA polymerase sigma subunit (sigma70/sigma32)
MAMAAYRSAHEPTNAPKAAGLRVYLEEVRRLPRMEPTEESRLLKRVGRGDTEALDEMTVRNLGLVADVVVDEPAEDDAIFDRLERGNQALLEAIITFPSSGRRDFRSYARSRILRTIRGLMQ